MFSNPIPRQAFDGCDCLIQQFSVITASVLRYGVIIVCNGMFSVLFPNSITAPTAVEERRDPCPMTNSRQG